jgi:hypothetical protein
MPASSRILLFLTSFLFPVFVLTACTNISALLPGKVFLPGTSAYNASVSSYFCLNERQSPAYIVAPSTANEVAEIVKRISSCTTNQIALRSGGHSPNRGFSNTDLGITIDLRGLNEIKINKTNTNIVSVGTGALWSDVYKFLDPLDLIVVGSRVASVGVGGFITGGKRLRPTFSYMILTSTIRRHIPFFPSLWICLRQCPEYAGRTR